MTFFIISTKLINAAEVTEVSRSCSVFVWSFCMDSPTTEDHDMVPFRFLEYGGRHDTKAEFSLSFSIPETFGLDPSRR